MRETGEILSCPQEKIELTKGGVKKA